MQENEDRWHNVPIKYKQDNQITKLFDDYKEWFKQFNVYMQDVSNLILWNSIKERNVHSEIVEVLNNQYIRVYGRCADMFNRHNSYTEWIGKISWNNKEDMSNLFTDHPSSWYFTGIEISRFAEDDHILWYCFLKEIKIHLFETFEIENWTMSIISKEEYEKEIDLHFKNI